MPFEAYAVCFYAKRTYRNMPGPTWLKVTLTVITGILIVTPGPDELLIPLGIALYRRFARKAL